MDNPPEVERIQKTLEAMTVMCNNCLAEYKEDPDVSARTKE